MLVELGRTTVTSGVGPNRVGEEGTYVGTTRTGWTFRV